MSIVQFVIFTKTFYKKSPPTEIPNRYLQCTKPQSRNSMKQIVIFLLIFKCTFFLSQESELKSCKVKYQIDTTDLNKSGFFKLQITNLESIKLKIPRTFSMMRIQAQNLEKYDGKLQKFSKEENSFVDVNCTKCNEKQFRLKPNETFVYNLDINNLYLVEKLNHKHTKYKFNLFFDSIDFRYNQNKKCYIENYESPKIIYKTK